MVKNTVNCYVPAMLAQGRLKRLEYPDTPLWDTETEEICKGVSYQLVRKHLLVLATTATDDWFVLIQRKQLAAAMWF